MEAQREVLCSQSSGYDKVEPGLKDRHVRCRSPQIYFLHAFSFVLSGFMGAWDAINSKTAFSFYVSLYQRVRGVWREKLDLREPDSSFLPINSPS